MGSSALFLVLVAVAPAVEIDKEEREIQETVFPELWNEDFEWRFARLPKEGSVAEDRIPYSGYIYLDTKGGTAQVLSKYDEFVNKDYSYPATAWENKDTSEAYSTGSRTVYSGFGRFRRARTVQTQGVNHWYGHCNGWASAALRHAEPQYTVKAYGTEFTPADIKGLLAEMYMYNEHAMLAGFEKELNPGILHAILANWLGRGGHPIVMDADPTKEKWNYPVYTYKSTSYRHSSREIEVRTNIGYVKDTKDGEHHKSPKIRETKAFHYGLELNRKGEITGGYYYTDSDKIDFVWVPLKPKPSGELGNEQGNPHLDVEKVLSIWRKSVPVADRRKWVIVDPPYKDRTLIVPDATKMLPRNIRVVPPVIPLESLATETGE